MFAVGQLFFERRRLSKTAGRMADFVYTEIIGHQNHHALEHNMVRRAALLGLHLLLRQPGAGDAGPDPGPAAVAAFGAEAGVAAIPFVLGVFARVRHGNTE